MFLLISLVLNVICHFCKFQKTVATLNSAVVVEILFCQYNQFISYDRETTEKISDFSVLTWLILQARSHNVYIHHCVYMAIYVLRYFPKIFGPNEDQPLDKEMTVREFEKLLSEVIKLLYYILCIQLPMETYVQMHSSSFA